jgi:hypothetical protein
MKTLGRPVTPPLLVSLAVSIAILACGGFVFSQETERSTTKATMRGIFITLTNAYKLSLDPKAFEDPSNHMLIQGMLQALVANANELERHGGGLDPSFGYMRRSLAKDANDALDRFNQGQYMGSRFVISKITENCVSCHTKLPAHGEFDIGAEFVKELEIKKLKPAERVNIELATRQFHAALKTYEQIFADPDISAEDLALLEAFEKYLRVCIGALNDTGRPIATFEAYNRRTDISAAQKKLVSAWIKDLKATDLKAAEGRELATARGLIEKAEAERKFPSDRSGLVKYVVGTTLLHRFVETGPGNDLEVAEAYYLMGVAESRITRSYWISETDFLLEQAIRKAPKSAIAKRAYEFLSEYTISGHLESSAREVSPELRANLDSLRALIEN